MHARRYEAQQTVAARRSQRIAEEWPDRYSRRIDRRSRRADARRRKKGGAESALCIHQMNFMAADKGAHGPARRIIGREKPRARDEFHEEPQGRGAIASICGAGSFRCRRRTDSGIGPVDQDVRQEVSGDQKNRRTNYPPITTYKSRASMASSSSGPSPGQLHHDFHEQRAAQECSHAKSKQ